MISLTDNLKLNFCIGLAVRCVVIIIGQIQDHYFHVAFTDVDYNVFTNGAKFVTNGKSPYDEVTYRYSPLIAYLLTPNIYVGAVFGKCLFSFLDLLNGLCIYQIVLICFGNIKKATRCGSLWFFNLLSIIIAARGNSDSLNSLLVLLTIYAHLKQNFVVSGLLLGFCTHLRLYPIILFLPLLFSAQKTKPIFYPSNYSKLITKSVFLLSFVASLSAFSGLFYYVYGDTFLQQSILYHFTRTDVRHNFSIYFYQQYLQYGSVDNVLQKLFMFVHAILLIALPWKYRVLKHLPFCAFCCVYISVIFNKVITAQYYIWYLSLLPLFLPAVSLSRKEVTSIIFGWSLSLAVWLSSAYALEFHGYNTFVLLWLSSVFSVFVNAFILKLFIDRYNATYRIGSKKLL